MILTKRNKMFLEKETGQLAQRLADVSAIADPAIRLVELRRLSDDTEEGQGRVAARSLFRNMGVSLLTAAATVTAGFFGLNMLFHGLAEVLSATHSTGTFLMILGIPAVSFGAYIGDKYEQLRRGYYLDRPFLKQISDDVQRAIKQTAEDPAVKNLVVWNGPDGVALFDGPKLADQFTRLAADAQALSKIVKASQSPSMQRLI